MPYATISDFERRLPQKTLEQLTGEVAGSAAYDAALDDALRKASAVIDGYAGVRYDLPLKGTDRLTSLAADIAAFELEKTRGVVRETDQKGYDDAIRFLRDLAAGKAGLDQPVGSEPQTGSADVKTSGAEGVFGDRNLQGF